MRIVWGWGGGEKWLLCSEAGTLHCDYCWMTEREREEERMRTSFKHRWRGEKGCTDYEQIWKRKRPRKKSARNTHTHINIDTNLYRNKNIKKKTETRLSWYGAHTCTSHVFKWDWRRWRRRPRWRYRRPPSANIEWCDGLWKFAKIHVILLMHFATVCCCAKTNEWIEEANKVMHALHSLTLAYSPQRVWFHAHIYCMYLCVWLCCCYYWKRDKAKRRENKQTCMRRGKYRKKKEHDLKPLNIITYYN